MDICWRYFWPGRGSCRPGGPPGLYYYGGNTDCVFNYLFFVFKSYISARLYHLSFKSQLTADLPADSHPGYISIMMLTPFFFSNYTSGPCCLLAAGLLVYLYTSFFLSFFLFIYWHLHSRDNLNLFSLIVEFFCVLYML